MTHNTERLVDLLIIGAGPVGLFGAFYAGLRQMSVKILDSLSVLGGQLATLYPEKYIYDVPGFSRILAKDLAARLAEQAMQYGPEVRLGQRVRELIPDPFSGAYTVATSDNLHPARTILIAAGIGSFTPKTLSLPEAARFEGRGLHYVVRDLDAFRNRRVLIVGGGDSAVDWGNTLAPIAASLTLIHRSDRFRAHEDSVARLKAGPARVLCFHELRRLEGASCVTSAAIMNSATREETTVHADDVIVNIGFESTLGPIRQWGLELEGSAIRVDRVMQTSRAGIFAAGDIATYPGKLKLIATGFAEACTAVNYAKTRIDPTARAFPGHSSEMK